MITNQLVLEETVMSSNTRPESMVRITNLELANAFIDEQVAQIRAQVGDKKVLLALSGGVDSSVVAALGAETGSARTPGSTAPFAMYHSLDGSPAPGYFGLALD